MEEMIMKLVLICLKNGQQIVCETDSALGASEMVCFYPLLINWQANQKKNGVLLVLTDYPTMAIHLIKTPHDIFIRISDSEIRGCYPDDLIKPEVKMDYERRKQEVYGTIAVVHTLPGALGRA